ncbi:GLPGLI family protein [Flavobacterium beibuense]|uniref:Porph_ging domain containing protein n=1 Tax=Flavobacterium beibuense TaxID=657326 RepID=A0A444WC78_9FLAO|nr:GLPGLI family protein [Flavobacterium beibuense]RYJ43420.1 Porph_ging domain containing protein [Flavobacterium beibuense]
MIKYIFYFTTLLLSIVSSYAQEFQGMAVYESKTSMADLNSRLDGNKDITPEMRKMIEERMKSMFEKTFTLHFDKVASIYEEEQKLDAPGQDGGPFKMMSSLTGGGGKQYKNVKDKKVMMEKDIFGKEFLVSDSLPVIKWKMENETKKIGNYTCYKATAQMPVDKSNMMNFRPKKGAEEKMKKLQEEGNEEELKKTNFMDMVEMPDFVEVTAWYTPEIPINQGPANYWGLPGLILEVNDGKTNILCSKIVLNTKEKVEIKEPKKGQKVTQEEFAEILMKKMQEMQQMGGPGGGGRMRMGG